MLRKLFHYFHFHFRAFYDNLKRWFDLSNHGERVDIRFNNSINTDSMDMYQINHYRRYQFADSIIEAGDCVGDFACGTGYGSIIISKKASLVIGGDINTKVIRSIQRRYRHYSNVQFIIVDLINLHFHDKFDKIISFETIEHLDQNSIPVVFTNYSNALKANGLLIFSVPFKQKKSIEAINLGFHQTFDIDENSISHWLSHAGFELLNMYYQNYATHFVSSDLNDKDFIICIAKKK